MTLVVFLALAQAQPALDQSTNTGFATGTYRGVRDFILRSAEKMPADQSEFKPTPDVRSFRDLVAHLTDAAQRCGAAQQRASDVRELTPPIASVGHHGGWGLP